jgi:hypothetical protein
MFVLNGKVIIGDYEFKTIHELEYTKSVDELVDTATIKLPTKFKIRGKDNVLKFTQDAIKIGDKVAITLGYENEYEATEFVGYVRRIRPTIPVEIDVEDAMWLLRRKTINKAWNTGTTLKEVLQEVVKDTGLKLANNIPAVPLDNYIIKNANGTQVLQNLKKNLPFAIFLNDANELYCGLRQLTNIGQSAGYDLNYNVIQNNLEFKTKDERQILVRYTYTDAEGTKKEFEFGDTTGEIRTFRTSIISDLKVLEQMAKDQIALLKFDGFEGSITSFLIPFATRGMRANIFDEEHKNVEGGYFINKVKVTFGTAGARRIVTIGTKL